MSSIVTAVLKLIVGMIVNKGRDKVAEKLKDGDVTDQIFRDLIAREEEKSQSRRYSHQMSNQRPRSPKAAH